MKKSYTGLENNKTKHSYIQLSILSGVKADWFDGGHHHHHTESHGDKEHDHVFGAIFQSQFLIFFIILFHCLQCVTLGSSIRHRLRIAAPPPFAAVLMPFSTVILKVQVKFSLNQTLRRIKVFYIKTRSVTAGPEINNRFTITWILKTWCKKEPIYKKCTVKKSSWFTIVHWRNPGPPFHLGLSLLHSFPIPNRIQVYSSFEVWFKTDTCMKPLFAAATSRVILPNSWSAFYLWLYTSYQLYKELYHLHH